MFRKIRSFQTWLLAAMAVAFMSLPAMAQYSIVGVNETTGAVEFTPGSLVDPVITGVVAIIAAAAALVVIGVGVKALFRWLKIAK